jgi:hypothetical protein
MKELGEIVKSWRDASGLDYAEVARRIAKLKGKPFNWQNIQNLEKSTKAIKRPLYLLELAKVMGTTVEALLAGVEPPPCDPTAAGAGSLEEPVAPLIREEATGLSRDDFLRIYDTLNPAQTQLLARLMSALGWVPGVTVEVIPRWKAELHKTLDNPGPKLMDQETGPVEKESPKEEDTK